MSFQLILNNTSPSSTLSSTHSSMSSLPITSKSIVKPSSAPPPPPIQISKPVVSISTSQMTQSLYKTKPPAVSDQIDGTNGINTNYNVNVNTKNCINTISGMVSTNDGIHTSSPDNDTKNGVDGDIKCTDEYRNQVNGDDIVKPLEEFKIDLDTQLDIPKTGFDFLDNW